MTRRSMRSGTATFALSAILAGALLVATHGRVWPHSAMSGMQYSQWCCNGDGHNGDCEPISDKTVTPIAGGFQIVLNVGDHHLVTRRHVFTIKQAEVKWSTDGQYHACLYPTEDTLRCFYAPLPGA